MPTYTRAGASAVDHKDNYTEEITAAVHKLIAQAWADPAFKQELIARPLEACAELGLHWPDEYTVEFYDDPAAQPGDWSTVGKGENSLLRIAIPPAPAEGQLSAEQLNSIVGGAAACCCCPCACCCTGAVSADTWY